MKYASAQITNLRVCKELADGDKSIIKLIGHLTDIEARALLTIGELRKATRPDSAGRAIRNAMSLSKNGMRRS